MLQSCERAPTLERVFTYFWPNKQWHFKPSMLGSIPHVTLHTWKGKVSNFGFARQTNTDSKSLQFWLQSWHKSFQCWLQCSTKKKKFLQCWVCMTNQHWHQNSSILASESFQSWLQKKTGQNWHFMLDTITLYTGVQSGFAWQTNTDTKISMLASMLYYQTQINNDISSPFSILGSIPHYYTYMKRHMSNIVFNTDTKSLQCWFSSLLKQVFTAKVCVRNHHTPKTNLCIYKCATFL